MAELVLKLVVDPKTGERSLVVDLRSDADALPMEHEEEHRAMVRKLMGGAGAGESGLQIERESVEQTGSEQTETGADQSEGIKNKA